MRYYWKWEEEEIEMVKELKYCICSNNSRAGQNWRVLKRPQEQYIVMEKYNAV